MTSSLERPAWLWRVQLLYADDVTPPQVGGELALSTTHVDEIGRDRAVQEGQGRDDIGRIVVEEPIMDDVTRVGDEREWRVWLAWTRQADGTWRHS